MGGASQAETRGVINAWAASAPFFPAKTRKTKTNLDIPSDKYWVDLGKRGGTSEAQRLGDG
jgi:hypothetical protein